VRTLVSGVTVLWLTPSLCHFHELVAFAFLGAPHHQASEVVVPYVWVVSEW